MKRLSIIANFLNKIISSKYLLYARALPPAHSSTVWGGDPQCTKSLENCSKDLALPYFTTLINSKLFTFKITMLETFI